MTNRRLGEEIEIVNVINKTIASDKLIITNNDFLYYEGGQQIKIAILVRPA